MAVPELGQIPGGGLLPIEIEWIMQRLREALHRFRSLKNKLKEEVDFYTSIGGSLCCEDTEKRRRRVPWIREIQQRREAVAANRMQDLMRQFGTIFRLITQHKYAWPFMHPVDEQGLGLHDYYEVIDKPMDFSTIENQMEAKKDGTGYKHVLQIYADMRLVFENAMNYNEETSDIYSMAKKLLEKFEGEWAHFLPKVQEEEKIREEEEKQAAKEASHVERTRELAREIHHATDELEKLRHQLAAMGRKVTTEEKLDLVFALSKLSPEDRQKVLYIVAQADPSFFPPGAEEVVIEMDALAEPTLWRIIFFVKDALEDMKKKKKKKKKEEETKTGDLNGTQNKRNATDKLAERRAKRSRGQLLLMGSRHLELLWL